MKFNIVLALTKDDPSHLHAQCFNEIADVLRYGLEDLGEEVIFGQSFRKDCINLVLGYQFLYGQLLPPEYKCIFYQLEELSENQGWPLGILATFQSKDCIIWDFSEKNIDFLAQRGIQAILKPIGFHPNMFRIKPHNTQYVDILFYGSKNLRRLKILNKLRQRFNTQVLSSVYGAERDEWLSRSKISVAIYHYETKLFDDVRISYLTNNKIFTVIEDSPARKYADFLVYSEYDKIVETCEYWLNSPDLRQQQVHAAFRAFSKYPESEFLRQALEKSL